MAKAKVFKVNSNLMTVVALLSLMFTWNCKVSAQYTCVDWTGAAIAIAALQNHADHLSKLGSYIWILCL